MKRLYAVLILAIAGCAQANGAIQPFGKGKAVEQPPAEAPKVATVAPAQDYGPDPAQEAAKTKARAKAVKAPFYSSAAELPMLSVPDYTEVVGEIFAIEAETNCKSVKFLILDKPGLSRIPDKFLNPDIKDAIVVQGILPGEYRVMAYTSLNDVLTDPVTATITITGHGPQPPPDPPGPGPGPGPKPPGPTPPPVVKAAKLVISTIDDAKKRTPDLTKFMTDPYWQLVRSKGHKADQYNATNEKVMATYAEQIKLNGGLPTIIIMDAVGNKWLNKSEADLKLPANAESLKTLLSKYTDNL